MPNDVKKVLYLVGDILRAHQTRSEVAQNIQKAFDKSDGTNENDILDEIVDILRNTTSVTSEVRDLVIAIRPVRTI